MTLGTPSQMDGNTSFQDSLKMRLDLIRPNRRQVSAFVHTLMYLLPECLLLERDWGPEGAFSLIVCRAALRARLGLVCALPSIGRHIES